MAVSCHVAFGHYLRTLRERRGLALEDVWTLSQTFPESLNKGYLSRCENGKQKLALPKVVAMSRIYEVPADVFLERLELDLELEKIGGPPTENLSWDQVRESSRNALQHGHRWAAYALCRDATFKVRKAELDRSLYSSIEEQIANTFINCATSALGLGKNRYALNEFQYAEESGHLGKDSSTLVADRLAVVHSCLGDLETAEEYAKQALKRLEESPRRRFEPYIYHLHGFLSFRCGKQSDTIPWFRKAYDSFRKHGLVRDSANTLISLADCYYDSGNLPAARRTLDVAKSVCESHSLIRIKALALTLTGLIDEDLGQSRSAEVNLREADEIAKKLNDRILRFQVEFYLLKHAVAQGNAPVARAIRRRLSKLALSVPASVEQLLDFRAMEKNLPPT